MKKAKRHVKPPRIRLARPKQLDLPIGETNLKVLPSSADVRDLPIAWLDVDVLYQRLLNAAQRNMIANDMDEDALGIIKVSKRGPELYYVIDGNTRVHACKSLGQTHITCEILENLTEQREAEIFLEVNKSRRKTTALDNHRAAVVAGDHTACDIDRVVGKYGYAVGNGLTEHRKITWIVALTDLYKYYGAPTLEMAFSLLGCIQNNNISNNILTAFCDIVHQGIIPSPADLDRIKKHEGFIHLNAVILKECRERGKVPSPSFTPERGAFVGKAILTKVLNYRKTAKAYPTPSAYRD